MAVVCCRQPIAAEDDAAIAACVGIAKAQSKILPACSKAKSACTYQVATACGRSWAVHKAFCALPHAALTLRYGSCLILLDTASCGIFSMPNSASYCRLEPRVPIVARCPATSALCLPDFECASSRIACLCSR